jgi:hypothetical protein
MHYIRILLIIEVFHRFLAASLNSQRRADRRL